MLKIRYDNLAYDKGVASVATPGQWSFANVTISTADKVFGAGAALCGNNYDSIITKTFPVNLIGTGDFTAELRFKWTDYTIPTAFIDIKSGNFTTLIGTDNGLPEIAVNGTGAIQGTATTLQDGGWHALALVRHLGVDKFYVDGVLQGTGMADTNDYSSGFTVNIGSTNDGSEAAPPASLADEFRLSNTARYLTNYTPAVAAFTVDANTLSLVHFDSAITTFIDAGHN